MEVILIILGVAVLVMAVLGVSRWMDHKRLNLLREVSEEMGLEFLADGSPELQDQLSPFNLFKTGRDRRLTRLMRGESDEVAISLFDYRYTTGSGKNTHTHLQTVAALKSPRLRTPDFTMRAENMLDKLGGLVGFADINFESHPKFSSMFVLKGPNVDAVRRFFQPGVLSYFEQHKGLSVESMPGSIILYRPGKRIAPKDIKSFLSTAYQVYGILVDNQPA